MASVRAALWRGPYFEKLEPGLYDALNNNEKDIKDVAMMKTILDQMKEFADLGYYGEDYLSNTVDAKKRRDRNSKSGHVPCGSGFALQVEEAYPEMKDQIGIFLMPFGDNDVLANNASSAAYFINKRVKTSSMPEFFRFLARPENLQYRQDNNPERWDSAGRRSRHPIRTNSISISILWKEAPSCR